MQALVEECFSSQLAGYNYTMKYIDAENDKISITCDAELACGVAESPNPFRVTVETEDDAAPPIHNAAPGGPLEIHGRVTCDGCGMSPLMGDRFKCSVRSDYDLCTACESIDQSGHPMLKIKKDTDAPAAILVVQHSDAPGQQSADEDESEVQTAEQLLEQILSGNTDVTLTDLLGAGLGKKNKPLRKALRRLLFKKGGRPPHGPYVPHTRHTPYAHGPHARHGPPHACRPHGPMGRRSPPPGMWRRGHVNSDVEGSATEEQLVAHAMEESLKANTTASPKLCARFVKHVTHSDKTPIAPGTEFTKSWQLRNDGQGPIPSGCALWHAGGDVMGGVEGSVIVPEVPPGEEFTISIPLQAPEESGRFCGYWRLAAPDASASEGRGPFFGHRLGVDVLIEPRPDTFEIVEGEETIPLRGKLIELGFTQEAVARAIDVVGPDGSVENAVAALLAASQTA